MKKDTLSPNQMTQHLHARSDTSNPKTLKQMTHQKLPTSQGEETLQTPTSGDRKTYKGLQQVYPTNTQ